MTDCLLHHQLKILSLLQQVDHVFLDGYIGT